MDAILIKDLEVMYRVGVTDAERAQPQRLLLSLEIERDFSAAAASDDINDTADYYVLTRRLLDWGGRKSWKLLERLGVEIADWVLMETDARKVTVEIQKFILPDTRFVGVRVTRPSRPARGPANGGTT